MLQQPLNEQKQATEEKASNRKYDKVQFIGYSIVTEFNDDDNKQINISTLNKEKLKLEIDERVQLLDNALKIAIDHQNTQHDSSVLKIFMLPEFFFRGPAHAYPMHLQSTDFNPADYLIEQLNITLNKYALKDWMCVLGTIVISWDWSLADQKKWAGKIYQTYIDDIESKAEKLKLASSEYASHPIFILPYLENLFESKSEKYSENLKIFDRLMSKLSKKYGDDSYERGDFIDRYGLFRKAIDERMNLTIEETENKNQGAESLLAKTQTLNFSLVKFKNQLKILSKRYISDADFLDNYKINNRLHQPKLRTGEKIVASKLEYIRKETNFQYFDEIPDFIVYAKAVIDAMHESLMNDNDNDEKTKEVSINEGNLYKNIKSWNEKINKNQIFINQEDKLKIGLEICLDHRFGVLKNTVAAFPEQKPDIHLIIGSRVKINPLNTMATKYIFSCQGSEIPVNQGMEALNVFVLDPNKAMEVGGNDDRKEYMFALIKADKKYGSILLNAKNSKLTQGFLKIYNPLPPDNNLVNTLSIDLSETFLLLNGQRVLFDRAVPTKSVVIRPKAQRSR